MIFAVEGPLYTPHLPTAYWYSLHRPSAFPGSRNRQYQVTDISDLFQIAFLCALCVLCGEKLLAPRLPGSTLHTTALDS